MSARFCSLALRLLVLFALLGSAASGRAAEVGPEQVIRDFYRWYVDALVVDRDPFEARADLQRYASERFLKEIDAQRASPDGLDADPFLSAQDFDKEWAKNVVVSELAIKEKRATAKVELKGTEMSTQLKLSLTQEEGGAWKIDSVEPK